MPAKAQARSRAVARAARIAVNARTGSAARRSITRDTVGVGGDRAEQLRLSAQHRDVGQAVPTQCQRESQIGDDLARVVYRPGRPPPLQLRR